MTSGENHPGPDQQVEPHEVESQHAPAQRERRLSPADLHNVRFTRASMMRPGYVDIEVDRVLGRVADEIGRLISEKAELRDQVRALQAQVEDHQAQVPPSEQAVRILASAQMTADSYVAEAEEFSRQVTAEARTQYEELTREARETAGAIIQAAHDAAGKMAPQPVHVDQQNAEQLQEQIAYLKAFGQATRNQLRSYLEALLADVEREWGRADPTALPQAANSTPAPRDGRPSATFESNTVTKSEREDDEVVQVVAVRE
jgi:DivIVA domain-containing protein